MMFAVSCGGLCPVGRPSRVVAEGSQRRPPGSNCAKRIDHMDDLDSKLVRQRDGARRYVRA
jgi:hypothetical protein